MIVQITFPVIVDLPLIARDYLFDRARFCGWSLNIYGASFTMGEAFFQASYPRLAGDALCLLSLATSRGYP